MHFSQSSLPDLNAVQARVLVLLNVDIDWEMRVDISHFVFETLCDTDDEVVDDRLHSS